MDNNRIKKFTQKARNRQFPPVLDIVVWAECPSVTLGNTSENHPRKPMGAVSVFATGNYC